MRLIIGCSDKTENYYVKGKLDAYTILSQPDLEQQSSNYIQASSDFCFSKTRGTFSSVDNKKLILIPSVM